MVVVQPCLCAWELIPWTPLLLSCAHFRARFLQAMKLRWEDYGETWCTGNCPHVLWESSSSASQGWHGTSVFTWLHYWALKVTMLVCIQTHSQGQSSFLIFLPWMCIPFWTFLLKLQWTGSFTKEDTKYLNSTNHRSELPHRQGQFTHCPGISNCPSIK